MMSTTRRLLAPLLAVLTLALPHLSRRGRPGRRRASPAAPRRRRHRDRSQRRPLLQLLPRRNCTRGLASGEVYGVEVYNDTTFETLYHYGRGKATTEWGAKRLLGYYVRLYAIRANGAYVRLAADETDHYDVGGAVGLRTPAAYTSSAPCDLRVKFGLGIRWSDGGFGRRGAWSDIFTNYDNPSCA